MMFSCGDPHRNPVGMGVGIPFPRQPWVTNQSVLFIVITHHVKSDIRKRQGISVFRLRKFTELTGEQLGLVFTSKRNYSYW